VFKQTNITILTYFLTDDFLWFDILFSGIKYDDDDDDDDVLNAKITTV